MKLSKLYLDRYTVLIHYIFRLLKELISLLAKMEPAKAIC